MNLDQPFHPICCYIDLPINRMQGVKSVEVTKMETIGA